MLRPPFPKTLRQFQLQFANEEACQQYLATCRWPEGYKCPRCAHPRGYALVGPKRWECAACCYQVSLTSRTVLHNTKTPLTLWFWAAYLMTTDKRGVSALLLQRQLGLQRYETAWMMLHKLRRAMVNVGANRSGVRSRSTIPGWAASRLASEGADSSRGAEPHLSWSLWRSAGQPRAHPHGRHS